MDWINMLGNGAMISVMTSVLLGLLVWWGGILKDRIRGNEHLQGMKGLQEQITKLNHSLESERDERLDLLKRGTLVFQAQFEKEFEIYVSLSGLMGRLYSDVRTLLQERLDVVKKVLHGRHQLILSSHWFKSRAEKFLEK